MFAGAQAGDEGMVDAGDEAIMIQCFFWRLGAAILIGRRRSALVGRSSQVGRAPAPLFPPAGSTRGTRSPESSRFWFSKASEEHKEGAGRKPREAVERRGTVTP